MKRVRVAVAPRPYDVLIGAGSLNARALKRALASRRGVIVSSRKVLDLHGPRLLATIRESGFDLRDIVLLADGEKAKTALSWAGCLRRMARAGLDRSSVIVAFGGGSIGDAAGFAAATYMRGIPFIQIPTTLLSMVDSSVGGKTGINLREGKNLVGSFHQPILVIADTDLLATLPARERRSGAFEIVKCALLRDRQLLALMERTRGLRKARGADLEEAIRRAVTVKARIVERDERESGERALLNLGHTVGHALEAATHYSWFTHGEAVGHGMAFAIDLSERLGLLSQAHARRLSQALGSLGPRRAVPGRCVEAAVRATAMDKKKDGATIREIVFTAAQRPRLLSVDAASYARAVRVWLRRESGLRA